MFQQGVGWPRQCPLPPFLSHVGPGKPISGSVSQRTEPIECVFDLGAGGLLFYCWACFNQHELNPKTRSQNRSRSTATLTVCLTLWATLRRQRFSGTATHKLRTICKK